MPLYDYRCAKCHHTFETLLSFSQLDSVITCPSCGHYETHRLISTSFSFVGGDDMKRRKEAEDKRIGYEAKKARELKASGKVPQNEVIKIGDKRLYE